MGFSLSNEKTMPTSICTMNKKTLKLFIKKNVATTPLCLLVKCSKRALKEVCSHEKGLHSKHVTLSYNAFENSGEKNA